MRNDFFLKLEPGEKGQSIEASTLFDHLAFNQDGLIPVITQDHLSKEVLMMAWMNRAAIEQTLSKGQMVYWSRSRQQFWHKGETSGHYQSLKEFRVDCDGDTILCLVEQLGAACHTGRPSCFYFRYEGAATSAEATMVITRSQPVASET